MCGSIWAWVQSARVIGRFTASGACPALVIALALIVQMPHAVVAAAAVHTGTRTPSRRAPVAASPQSEKAASPALVTSRCCSAGRCTASPTTTATGSGGPLDQVAQDLSNRGLTATGVVVVDRTQTTAGCARRQSVSDVADLTACATRSVQARQRRHKSQRHHGDDYGAAIRGELRVTRLPRRERHDDGRRLLCLW